MNDEASAARRECGERIETDLIRIIASLRRAAVDDCRSLAAQSEFQHAVQGGGLFFERGDGVERIDSDLSDGAETRIGGQTVERRGIVHISLRLVRMNAGGEKDVGMNPHDIADRKSVGKRTCADKLKADAEFLRLADHFMIVPFRREVKMCVKKFHCQFSFP